MDLLAENGVVMSVVGLAAVVIGVVMVFMLRTRQKVPPNHHLPPVWSTGLPFIGNLIAFANSPLGTIKRAYDDLGPVFSIKLGPETCTFLLGAEPHATFFEATDEEADQAEVYKFMTPIFGNGIVYDCPLAKRREQLRALGTSLKASSLRKYIPIIAKETQEYLKAKWGDKGQIDLLPSMAELIILTASATLLGPEVRGEMFLEVSHLYEMLDKGLTPLSVFFPYLPTDAHRKRDDARKGMVELFSKIIERRRADPENAAKNIDILQKLMKFQYKDGTPLTDDEITGMLIAALFAGQHTSSISTTWSLLFLLQDQKFNQGKYMNQVLDELASLEPTPFAFANGEGLDAQVIAKEQQLYACIKEAIRMHPPLILLMRRVVVPLIMPDGTYIPKGHRIMVSNALAQRLPEIYENPDEYRPDRWTDFDITKLPKYSHISFGAGAHTCMGESFAFMQIRTILSVILSTYDMELMTKFPEPNYEAMVVPPKGPNMIKYSRRSEPISNRIPESLRASVSTPITGTFKCDEGDQSDDLKVYTMEEVAKHNKADDVWIIVRGRVFEVTNYLRLHQGGQAAILRWGGKDATAAVEGPQHPGTVPTLLEKYLIGTLAKQ